MHGLSLSVRAWSLLLIVLTMNLAMLPVTAEDEGGENGTETVRDGRVIGVLTSPEQTYERTWFIEQNEWMSLSVDCDQCTVLLEIDGTSTEITNQVTYQAIQNGTASMQISSPITEFVSYSLIERIDETNPTVRPSPGEAISNQEAWLCTEDDRCADIQSGLEAVPSTEFINGEFVLGVVENNQAEYVAVQANAGQTLELQVLHATQDLSVQVYFQTEIEVQLNGILTQETGLETNLRPDAEFWHAESDGRFMLKIESESPRTAYALKQVLHAPLPSSLMVNISQETIIQGHHHAVVIVETTDTESFSIIALHRNVSADVEQLVDGTWLSATQFTFSVGTMEALYPYPNTSAFRFTIHGERFALEVATTQFDDLGSTLEAPSQRPSTPSMNNESWPTLQRDTDPIQGQLTLAIHDTADVYKLEIIGYEDSIHLVQVSLVGANLEVLQIDMWELDQTTWETIDTRNAVRVNGKVQTALELPPGTHFVRVSHNDVSNATNHSWGSQVSSIPYMITTASQVIDEGYEPYFPPDESTVRWGEVARWFMGLLFLAPCIYFAVIFSSNRRLALEMSTKTQQLAWFKQQMDTGEVEPNTLRKTLDKSLQAIAQLDWATACTTWGPTDGEHRTDGIAMAVWVLDQRLAKNENTLPVMVGIHVIKGQWELAALRFDAPEGEAYTIKRVEPRFLHRGEEIFLDTMNEGNITFLTVELSGSATSVDIEINGRCDGIPSAARMPQAIGTSALEEE
tara:strand:- start:170 stop:2398 length:2229 start_codon:yes stop_codon:yes gene_type:complete